MFCHGKDTCALIISHLGIHDMSSKVPKASRATDTTLEDLDSMLR